MLILYLWLCRLRWGGLPVPAGVGTQAACARVRCACWGIRSRVYRRTLFPYHGLCSHMHSSELQQHHLIRMWVVPHAHWSALW